MLFYVAQQNFSINADAALRGNPYLNTGTTPLRFDDAVAGGVIGTHKQDETTFATAEEAQRAIDKAIANAEALVAFDPRSDTGIVLSLRPQKVGSEHYGGTLVLDHAPLIAARANVERVKHQKEQARLAVADKKAQEAKSAADELRAQLTHVRAVPTPTGGRIKSAPGIQQELTPDGTFRTRARKAVDGKTIVGPWITGNDGAQGVTDAIAGWEDKTGRGWDAPAVPPAPVAVRKMGVDPEGLAGVLG